MGRTDYNIQIVNRFINRVNRRISFGNAASLLVAVALVGQVLGFLRNRLISTNFTVTDPGSSDAFFVAFMIPDFFYFTIAAGALGVAFMPYIATHVNSGDRRQVWRITSSLMNILAITMFAIGIIILVFADPLVRLLAPNLQPENFEQAVTIMRLISMNPLFFSLSGIITSVQQSYGRFFFFAIGPLVYNLTIIASIFLFKDTLGVVGLGWGALLGALLALGTAFLGVIGLGFCYYPKIAWKNTDFKGVLRQLPPRSLDQGIDQVNSIVEINRAQALGVGPVSYYNFALTLHNVPIMLLGTSLATAAFPRFTERLAQGRHDLFRKDFLKILRIMIWLTMPTIVVAYFARGYLARLIFGDVAPEVALIFGYLTVAILFRIIYSLVSRYFYAQKDTRTPLYVSIFAIALNIYLAFTLSRPDSYGISGLALAQSIVAVTEVLILSVIMVKRDPKLLDPKFLSGLLRILSVTGFAIVAAFLAVSIFPLLATDRGFVSLVAKLSFITAATFGVYVGISLLFSLEEAKPVIRRAKAMLLKPIRVYR